MTERSESKTPLAYAGSNGAAHLKGVASPDGATRPQVVALPISTVPLHNVVLPNDDAFCNCAVPLHNDVLPDEDAPAQRAHHQSAVPLNRAATVKERGLFSIVTITTPACLRAPFDFAHGAK